MTIGERIKQARLKAECTQQQLADMIGVAKSTVTGYEKGTREPDSLKINAIAKALNVSGDYLLGTEYDWLPSAEAMKIAHKFDKLDPYGQGLVKMVVDYELERVMPQETQAQQTTGEIFDAISSYQSAAAIARQRANEADHDSAEGNKAEIHA